MIDDPQLIEAIDKSPLSPEDKQHWKDILYKLNSEQRERLHHSLTSKTEIKRAINLIERALKIISEAEQEAEQEVQKEQEDKSDKDKLLKELEEIRKTEEDILLDENQLKQKQEETKAEILQIREDIKKLSMEAHGTPPPSYVGPSAQIPQLRKSE